MNITQGEASSFQTESVENEIKLMTQLRSQFIVSFYGAMVCQLFLFLFLILFPQRSPDSIYIVIEYCQKGSLTNHLGSNKLSPELKRLIALDCAKGMLVLFFISFYYFFIIFNISFFIQTKSSIEI